MEEFNFYNSENDGYRGGFGDYVDPVPNTPFQPGIFSTATSLSFSPPMSLASYFLPSAKDT